MQSAGPSEALTPIPLPAEKRGGGCGTGVIIVLVLLVLATIITAIRGGENPPTTTSEKPNEDVALRIAAQNMVKEHLRDPESASFREVRVVRKAETVAVCGEVNAKNGFGGFTGFDAFVVTGSTVLLAPAYDKTDFTKFWNYHC